MKIYKSSVVLAVHFFSLTANYQAFAQSINPHQINWSGIYFGASAGSGSGNATTSFSKDTFTNSFIETVFSITHETTTNLASGTLKGSADGSMANLFIGINMQPMHYPDFVFGGQLEGNFFNEVTLATYGQQRIFNVDTVDDGVIIATSTTQTTSNIELRDTLSSMFTFLGRGGFLVNPNTLIYILGGGVEGNFVIPNDTLLLSQKRNKWSTGYLLGTGLEYKFNVNWSLRGEYRYINFSNIKRNQSTTEVTFINPEGPNNTTNTTTNIASFSNSGFDFNMGMIAVVYQFS